MTSPERSPDRHELANRRRAGADWEELKAEFELTESDLRNQLAMARDEESCRWDSGWRLNPRALQPGAILMGPYDEEVVEDLKDRIPAKHRHFNEALRGWVIAPEAVSLAREFIGDWAPRPCPDDPPDTRTDVDLLAEALIDLGDAGDRAAALALALDVLATEGLRQAIVVGRELLGDEAAEIWPL